MMNMEENPYEGKGPSSQINCIFCGWYRKEDRSKGATPFDPAVAATELAEHLDTVHTRKWFEFLAIALPGKDSL